MRISKYTHSCLLIEKGDDRILFDPGKFSFIESLVRPEQFENLSAVVITHQHPDHVDDESLKKILGKNPAALVITNAEIRSRLASEGIRAKLLEDGVHDEVGEFARRLAPRRISPTTTATPKSSSSSSVTRTSESSSPSTAANSCRWTVPATRSR